MRHPSCGGYPEFASLATLAPDQIREVLTTADPGLSVHNPATWPEQANLAAAGEWEKLTTWQDELHGGLLWMRQGNRPRRLRIRAWMTSLDRGIGPKIRGVLHAAG